MEAATVALAFCFFSLVGLSPLLSLGNCLTCMRNKKRVFMWLSKQIPHLLAQVSSGNPISDLLHFPMGTAHGPSSYWVVRRRKKECLDILSEETEVGTSLKTSSCC